MANLVSVADGLTPQDDYDFLPPSVVAWAGYVGKPEVGAWTRPQIDHLEATGRRWLPIWTPGDGTTYTRAAAVADAAAMIAGLHALGIADNRTVFLDIERSRWINTQAQTNDAAAYWCLLMRASGWLNAGWYGPKGSTAQWIADWTGVPPDVLPPGVWGIQYDHALAGDRYDISRFDAQLLEVNDMPTAQEIADAIFTHPTIPVETGGLAIPYGVRVADLDRHLTDVKAYLADISAGQTEIIAALHALAPPPPAV